jgi:hypothetical protein
VTPDFQQQKAELSKRFISGELEPREYWQLSDELLASHREMLRLEKEEAKALQVEEAIKRAGGAPLKNRPYGTIPNPWMKESYSLTNICALEKNGDFNLVSILKHEAGVLSGDRRLAMAKAESERLEKQQRILDQTAAYRAANDAKLNRQTPHPDFAEAWEESRRKNSNMIPRFGG